MTEQEIIDYAIEALNELDPQKQQDDVIILQRVIDETKKLCVGKNDVLHGVSKTLPEDICKVHGHVMYPVYKLDNTANGHTSHFGQNKCSRCGYEEDWQYDM